jgi:hypothetical protein
MFLAEHKHRDENGIESFAYDYNYEGLAHAGLLPDFVADLRSTLPAASRQPLFRSAEAYLQMWEAIEKPTLFRPSISIATTPARPASDWFTGDVAVSLVGSPHPDGGAIGAIRYSAAGAGAIAPTSVAAAQTTLVIGSEGTTTVSAEAEDRFGISSLPATVELRIDRSGPVAACNGPDGSWHADNVSVDCSASDALSGLADPAAAAFALSTNVPAGVETAGAATGSQGLVDLAGNLSTAGPVTGNRIDRKAPSIAITVPAGGTYAVHQVVAASYTCADGGSGVATCAGPVPLGGALDTATPGTKTFAVEARDAVGNAGRASSDYEVGYNVCLLYDPTKVKKLGSTVPIKLQICDAAGANLSQPSIGVTATSVHFEAATTTGPLDDSGNANPDLNFRYDPSLTGYIFNLKTSGLGPGRWQIRFRIGGDPGEHGAEFQLR